MSKRKLYTNNLILFLGGNLANGFNFLLSFLLLKETELFNIYNAFSSASLILFIPSLTILRIFTEYGPEAWKTFIESISNHSHKIYRYLIIFLISLIPLAFFLNLILEDSNFNTSALLIVLSILSFIVNILRGIQQHNGAFLRAVISINLEFLIRLTLGYFLGLILGWGMIGILFSHIIGIIVSILIAWQKGIFEGGKKIKENIIKNKFFKTMLMSGGLEFYSNFDIIYGNIVLQNKNIVQTEFNTLQLFRKVIFFGIYSVSSIIYSIAADNKYSRKFVFFFTLGNGFVVGLGFSSVFYIFGNLFLKLIDRELEVITFTQEVIFLLSTTLMATSYLLANWLFTLKKKRYIYLPVVVSYIQVLTFFVLSSDFNSLLIAFLISNTIFFTICIFAGIKETFRPNLHKSNHH